MVLATGGINCSQAITNLLLLYGTINTTPSDPTHTRSLMFFLFGLVFPMRLYATSVVDLRAHARTPGRVSRERTHERTPSMYHVDL